MKTRYYILAGIVYTLVVGFVVETVSSRMTTDRLIEHCEIDGCGVVREYTGEVGGVEWEELIVIAEEAEEEAG